MLFNLYNPRVISSLGTDPRDPKKDWTQVWPILGKHSEIPREEYNYSYNSDGLRSIEFSTKPKIIALGCSITLGQGLPVEQRWSDLLSKQLDNEPIGNISYSGASIAKDVSSFFGLIHQYEYLPEIVICNFANFERLYFISNDDKYIQDWYLNSPKVSKAEIPWDYNKIIPIEWAYWTNLDHIKMLEAFCSSTGIKLIWSSWSMNLDPDQERYLRSTFKNYAPDPDRWLFPRNFEFGPAAGSIETLPKNYEMLGWDGIRCHEDYKEKYPETFLYGYDYHKIAGEWGEGAYWPHPGLHRQLHFSDFYYKKLKEKSWR